MNQKEDECNLTGMIDKSKLSKAVIESWQSGDRLYEDAKQLQECERFPTAYSLFILAQEEFAKSFLLQLVTDDSLPWSIGLQRALRNHNCKQLAGLIMDYIQRDDFLVLMNDPNRFKGASTLPLHIIDAIHLIVHEFVFKRSRSDWLYEESRKLDPIAVQIAKGMVDREKQSGFYVQLGFDGNILSTPTQVSATQCQAELERTHRIRDVINCYQGQAQINASFDYPKIVALFKVLTGATSIDEFNENWWK